jgi:hypothetical protein
MPNDILHDAAAALGRKGGKSRSAEKVAASRANGRKNIKRTATPASATEKMNNFSPLLITRKEQ